MDDAVGATNLQGANETFKFMAKSSNKDNDLDGVFSSNLARLGGIKTLAGQVEKAFYLCKEHCCACSFAFCRSVGEFIALSTTRML